MRKYMRAVLLAVLLGVMAVPVRAAGKDEITLVLPVEAGQGYTSLRFGMKVSGVPEGQSAEMNFDEKLKEKAKLCRAVYREETGYLTVYLSGTEDLFPASEENEVAELVIGRVTASEGGEDLTVQLDVSTIEAVNGAHEVVKEVTSLQSDVKLLGERVAEPILPPDGEQEKNAEDLWKELEELVALARETYPESDRENYTQKSWEEFQAILEQMQALLDGSRDEAALQQLPTAVRTMMDIGKVFVSFQKSGDVEIAKEQMRELLEELDQLVSSDYTQESWEALYSLMEDARELLEREDAATEELDALRESMLDARKALVPAGESGGGTPPASGDSGTGSGGSSSGTGSGGAASSGTGSSGMSQGSAGTDSAGTPQGSAGTDSAGAPQDSSGADSSGTPQSSAGTDSSGTPQTSAGAQPGNSASVSPLAPENLSGEETSASASESKGAGTGDASQAAVWAAAAALCAAVLAGLYAAKRSA